MEESKFIKLTKDLINQIEVIANSPAHNIADSLDKIAKVTGLTAQIIRANESRKLSKFKVAGTLHGNGNTFTDSEGNDIVL